MPPKEDQVVEQVEELADEEQTEVAAAKTDTSADESDADEVVVTIGDAQPADEEENHAPEWVRDLRKKNREDQRRIRELEEQLKVKADAEKKPAALGKKPALEDFDYDTEKFEAELTAWFDRKRQHDDAESKAKADEEAAQSEWKKRLATYTEAKGGLKVQDFEDAESTVQEQFSVTQQGILIQGAENAAILVYALGKNPAKAKELADIKDPVKFAFAVAKLETQLKVTNRKSPPPPEKQVTGTAPKSGAVDSTLDRLRADAEKTGDYTKVAAYKKQKRAA